MSIPFLPNSVSADASHVYWNDPRQAMLKAFQDRGMHRNNFMVQMQLRNAERMEPLAMAYGANKNNFMDFVNNYITGRMSTPNNSPQNQFSNDAIKNQMYSFMGGNNADANEYFAAGGDPQEQWRNFTGAQQWAMEGQAPQMAQARMRLHEDQFSNWFRNNAENPEGQTYQTWLDQFLGRPTAQANYTPTPGTMPGVSPTVPGQPAPAPGAPGAAPATGQKGANYAGSTVGQNQKGGGRAYDWTGTLVSGPAGTPESFKPQRVDQGALGPFEFGGIRYDSSRDTARTGYGFGGYAHALYRYSRILQTKPNLTREQAWSQAVNDLRTIWTNSGLDWARSGFM